MRVHVPLNPSLCKAGGFCPQVSREGQLVRGNEGHHSAVIDGPKAEHTEELPMVACAQTVDHGDRAMRTRKYDPVAP
jgi:hypothetical protein